MDTSSIDLILFWFKTLISQEVFRDYQSILETLPF